MIDRSFLRTRLAAVSVGLVLAAAPAGCADSPRAEPTGTPVTSTAAGETTRWNHDPASPIGPTPGGPRDRAGRACASREGQSPVAITTTRPAHLAALRVD